MRIAPTNSGLSHYSFLYLLRYQFWGPHYSNALNYATLEKLAFVKPALGTVRLQKDHRDIQTLFVAFHYMYALVVHCDVFLRSIGWVLFCRANHNRFCWTGVNLSFQALLSDQFQRFLREHDHFIPHSCRQQLESNHRNVLCHLREYMAKTILYDILGHLHADYAEHCHLFRPWNLWVNRRRDGSRREEKGIGSQIDG